MKSPLVLPLVLLTAFAGPATAINMELSKLVSQDQEDRQALRRSASPEGGADGISARDYQRRTQVVRMLREGSIREPIDYENAALIFQHGQVPEEFRLAHALATIALAIEPERRFAMQLKKLSWDRFMLSI